MGRDGRRHSQKAGPVLARDRRADHQTCWFASARVSHACFIKSDTQPKKMITVPVAPHWAFVTREHKERRSDDRSHLAKIVQTEPQGGSPAPLLSSSGKMRCPKGKKHDVILGGSGSRGSEVADKVERRTLTCIHPASASISHPSSRDVPPAQSPHP